MILNIRLTKTNRYERIIYTYIRTKFKNINKENIYSGLIKAKLWQRSKKIQIIMQNTVKNLWSG